MKPYPHKKDFDQYEVSWEVRPWKGTKKHEGELCYHLLRAEHKGNGQRYAQEFNHPVLPFFNCQRELRNDFDNFAQALRTMTEGKPGIPTLRRLLEGLLQ